MAVPAHHVLFKALFNRYTAARTRGESVALTRPKYTRTGPFGRPKNCHRLISEHVSRHTLTTATFIHIPHGCLRNTRLITAHCSANSRFKSTVKGRAAVPVYVLRRQRDEQDGHARGFTSTGSDSAGSAPAERQPTQPPERRLRPSDTPARL